VPSSLGDSIAIRAFWSTKDYTYCVSRHEVQVLRVHIKQDISLAFEPHDFAFAVHLSDEISTPQSNKDITKQTPKSTCLIFC